MNLPCQSQSVLEQVHLANLWVGGKRSVLKNQFAVFFFGSYMSLLSRQLIKR